MVRILVPAVALLVWQSQAPQKPKSETNQQIAATNQRGTPQAPVVIELDSVQHRQEAEQREAERKEKTASDNALIFYTKLLAFVAFLQLVVFGYQALKLRATVDRMREAERITAQSVNEMRRAAEAAERSASAAERAVVITQRAYLFAKGIDQATNTDAAGHLVEYWFWATWENFGLTPATDARSVMKVQHLPMLGGAEPNFTDGIGGPGAVFGPHTTGKSATVIVPLATMKEVWQKKTRLFLWARGEYRDAFRPSVLHHHEVCVQVGLIHEPSTPPPPNHPAYVTFAVYGPQNSTDLDAIND